MLTRILDTTLQAITIGLLIGLAVIVLLAVVFRMLGDSFIWYDEVASVWLAWLTYYSAALAALKRSHLGFSSFLYGLPSSIRNVLFIVAEFAVITFFAVVAWYGWKVLDFMTGEALISVPWMPMQVVQSVIPVGAMLFILAQLVSFPDAWHKQQRGYTPEQEEIDVALRDTAPGAS